MIRYDLEYTPDVKTTLEGMKLAGGAMFKGAKAPLLWAQILVTALLVPAGFMAVVLIVKILVTGSGTFAQPFWFPALFVLGGVLSFWLSNQIYVVMARAAVTSRFGRRVRISAAPDGFVFAGGQSEWRMVWADIDDVVNGRTAMAVCTGGVALPVPHAAFDTPEAAKAAFEQMAAWHREAIA